MGSLTLTQEIVMVAVGLIGSIFSIIGSMMIILHLYYRYHRTKKQSITRGSSRRSNSNKNNSSNKITDDDYNNNQSTSSIGVGAGTNPAASTTTILTSHNNNTNNHTTISAATEATGTTTTTTTQEATPTNVSFGFIQRRMGIRNRNTDTKYYSTMLGTTDRRILFLMSFFDILQSIVIGIEPFLLDRYSKHFNIGFGTYTTCQVAGTVHHITFSSGLYACMLNIYYLLTVRYGWSQSRIDKSKVEWLMHLVAFGWLFSTGLAGAIIGFMGSERFNMGCWIGEYPRGCAASNGTIPCRGTFIALVVGVPIYSFYVCVLFISNTLIYLHVRKISKKSLYWGIQNRQQHLALLPNAAGTTPVGEQQQQQQQQQSSANTNTATTACTRILGKLLSDRAMTRGQSSDMLRIGRGFSSTSDLGRSATINTIDDIEEIHRRRCRRVGMQGVYYVCAGVVIYTPFLITQIVLKLFDPDKVSQSQVYGLLLIQAIVSPLDGLCNAFIYFRPRYLDLRYNQRNRPVQMTIFETVWACVFGEGHHNARNNNHRQRRYVSQSTNVSVRNTSNQFKHQQQHQHQQQQQQIVTTDITSTNLTGSTATNDLSGSITKMLDRINEEPDTNDQIDTNNVPEQSIIKSEPIDRLLSDDKSVHSQQNTVDESETQIAANNFHNDTTKSPTGQDIRGDDDDDYDSNIDNNDLYEGEIIFDDGDINYKHDDNVVDTMYEGEIIFDDVIDNKHDMIDNNNSTMDVGATQLDQSATLSN